MIRKAWQQYAFLSTIILRANSMARLPIPDSDGGNWGNILNDYLLQEHGADGTHQFPTAPAILVAANNAPARLKVQADYICDGTSDQVEINQALTDLGAIGGQVFLSQGVFNCTGAVQMRRRTFLRGQGRATILKALGTWGAFDGLAQGALIEPLNDGIDKTTVFSLTLDGNRWSGANIHGIYYNITRKDEFDEGPDAAHIFTDIYILQTRQHGVYLQGSNMRANALTRIRVYNVGKEGESPVAHGFYINCPDSFYTQCESGSSSGSGFWIAGANNRFTNCKSWYSDLSGFHIASVRSQYAACESQDNQEHGFYVGSGPNSFVACHADSNSWNGATPTASYDGFHIPWGSRIQLVGCSAYDKNEGGRGNWQRYGFYVGSSASHIQIIGTVKDNATGATGGSGIGSATNLIMVNG